LERIRGSSLEWTISSNNQREINYKLNLIVTNYSHLARASAILESRHCNPDLDLSFIKDTLTFVGKGKEKTNELISTSMVNNKIKAIQDKIRIHLKLYDSKWFDESLIGRFFSSLNLKQIDISVYILSNENFLRLDMPSEVRNLEILVSKEHFLNEDAYSFDF
jgi:hypothetical protein